MIGKFVTASSLTLVLTVFLGAQAFAQGTPAQAPATPPAAQQPASTPAAKQPDSKKTDQSQEASDEETISRRRARRQQYKKWAFNVGGGANTTSGTTYTFVRGGGEDATAGVARNANQYLGLRADFIFADLPVRDSSLELAQASSATNYALALTLDPIINIPVTKLYSGYVLFGPSYIHRMGSLSDDTAVPGSACNPFWQWWGACANVSIPLSGSFTHSSQNDFGYNFGFGVTRKMPSGVELYAEYRFMHGSSNGITTDFRPITIGVRWGK